MSWRPLTIVPILACSLILLGCSSSPPAKQQGGGQRLVILCPKTFADVLKQVKPAFEKANPGCTVLIDAYPIRPMLNDVLQGKKGDLFLSPGNVELSRLREKNLLREETERPFAETTIVALAASSNPLELKALVDITSDGVQKISIPDPTFNSAGAAFIEAARRKGIYDTVKHRLHHAPGPKSSTEYMEEGKAEVSITYSKCYYGHAKKNALIEFVPTDIHEPIVCKAVIFRSCQSAETARRFIEFLLTDENQRLFEKAHFKRID